MSAAMSFGRLMLVLILAGLAAYYFGPHPLRSAIGELNWTGIKNALPFGTAAKPSPNRPRDARPVPIPDVPVADPFAAPR
jgi:hypothetical protein